MATATSVRLVLSSQVRLIDLAHSAAESLAGVAGFNEDEALNLGIAVREAVINAMVHGNRQDPTKKVDIEIEADGIALVAKIRDHGGGFSPEATPNPLDHENLLNTSGRGLLMIRAYVDDVKFSQHEEGMEVTLTKRIPPA